MNIDEFGAVMDKFLEENEIWMGITLPEGTTDPEIKDNVGAGPVMQLYIVANTLPKIIGNIIRSMGDMDVEQAIDGIFELIKRDIMDQMGQEVKA